MATPTWLVQMDVSGTAFGGAPTWTDVTSWVLTTGDGQPIEVTWGRQDETSDVQPATCTVTFDNNDGRFTPDVATLTTGGANPFYPNVDLTTRMRVSVTVGGTTYVRADGYITDITILYPGGATTSCVAQVTFSDISNRLSNDQPLGTMVEETILVDQPYIYMPLTDAATAVTPEVLAAPTGAVPSLRRSKYGGGSFSFGTGTGPTAEASSALVITQTAANQGYVIDVPFASTSLGGDWATIMGVRLNWTGSATSGTLAALLRVSAPVLTVTLDGTGKPVGTFTARSGTFTVTGPSAINDGKPHDIELTLDPTAVAQGIVGQTSLRVGLFVDGSLVASTTTTIQTNVIGGTVAWTVDEFQIAGLIANSAPSGLTSGTYSHAAVLSSATCNTADHYTAGKTGFAGETTTAHYTRLLAFRPNTGTNLDTGKGTVGLHPVDNVTLWQALLETSHAEGGVVYIDGQGRVATRNRATQYDPASSLTLDVSSRQVEGGDLTFKRDSQNVTNDVQVTRPSGSAQRIVNGRLKTKHGQRVYSGTINVNSDRDLRDAAGWLIALLGTPRTKAPTVTVRLDIEPSTAQAQAVLAATVWSVVSVTNLPGTAPATTTSLLIEGGTERIGVDVWSVTFVTAALPPKTLRADATPSANTKLDAGLVVPW